MDEQNTVSKAVARINKSEAKINRAVVCRKCSMAGHKVVDCLKQPTPSTTNLEDSSPRQVRQPSQDPVHCVENSNAT